MQSQYNRICDWMIVRVYNSSSSPNTWFVERTLAFASKRCRSRIRGLFCGGILHHCSDKNCTVSVLHQYQDFLPVDCSQSVHLGRIYICHCSMVRETNIKTKAYGSQCLPVKWYLGLTRYDTALNKLWSSGEPSNCEKSKRTSSNSVGTNNQSEFMG